jgi:hypothetical protein
MYPFVEDALSAKVMMPGVFIIFFFGYVGLKFLYELVTDSLLIRINQQGITIVNLFQFRKIHFTVQDLKGYSKAASQSKALTFPSIVLYLKNGQTFELMSFNYFNFGGIEQQLKHQKVKYLGQEGFNPNLWLGKYYIFKKP